MSSMTSMHGKSTRDFAPASGSEEMHTVKNIYVNLTELPGSPSNRQYYFICHILTGNL